MDKPIGVYAYYHEYKHYMLNYSYFDNLFHIPVDFPERASGMKFKRIVYLEIPTKQTREFLDSKVR